jgi:hypothetical protein
MATVGGFATTPPKRTFNLGARFWVNDVRAAAGAGVGVDHDATTTEEGGIMTFGTPLEAQLSLGRALLIGLAALRAPARG